MYCKTTTVRAPTTAGTTKNVGNICGRRDLNSSRVDSNSRDKSHSRDSRDETTAGRTHQQKANRISGNHIN
jgi:hypothetical protein